MGTTLTAAYVHDDTVVVAHVGDSRCYLLRDGDLIRLTRDHSLVGELVARGKLTEAQAEAHPQRSVITRALGAGADVEVDVEVFPARGGDLFLVCSDGLTGMVHEPQLKPLLQQDGSLEQDGPLADRRGQRGRRARQHHRDPLPPGGHRRAGRHGRRRRDRGVPGAGHRGVRHVRRRGRRAAPGREPPVRRGRRRRGGGVPPHGHGRAAGPSRDGRRVRGSGPRATARADRAPAGAHAVPAPPQRWRPGGGLVLLLLGLVLPLLVGAWLATRAVYFVGTDPRDDTTVAIFRGLPYELPFGIDLYERWYTSGVTLEQVPPARRETFTDHQLRSRDDVEDLVRALERGNLE